MTQPIHHRSEFLPGFPSFAQELAGTLAVHSQYVLYGNVRDVYLTPEPTGRTPDGMQPVPLLELLWRALRPSGYRCLIVSDQVDGIAVYPPNNRDAQAAAEQMLGRGMLGRKQTLERLRTCMARVAGTAEPPPIDPDAIQTDPQAGQAPTRPEGEVRAAFVIDYAARIPRRPNELDGMERDFFLFAQKLAVTAGTHLGGPPQRPSDLFNPIIWLTEGERDLPAWLTVGMERVRTIAVPTPTLTDRTRAARYYAPAITGQEQSPDTSDPDLARFVRRTDDMTLHAVREIARLCADRQLPLSRIEEAIQIYRIGVSENPWLQETVRQQIRQGQAVIPDQIVGQDAAVTKAFDILKRAAIGLSGAQATSTANRPRGVLFLAGPTGVGKTELARALAEVLFGDENSMIRVDMSEYMERHAVSRLVGAPPGYVGFDEGGQLTERVRRKPYSVILLDEIEKAHPEVFNILLQVLEDGRLTDAKGRTVDFKNTVIIMTSNVGADQIERSGAIGFHVTRDEEENNYQRIKDRLLEELKKAFRPEFLNRIDETIVFHPLTRDQLKAIVDLMLKDLDKQIKDRGLTLEVTPEVRELLAREGYDQMYGARPLRRAIQRFVENPLSDEMLKGRFKEGDAVRAVVKNEQIQFEKKGA